MFDDLLMSHSLADQTKRESDQKIGEPIHPGTLSTLARGLRILEFVIHAGRFVRLRDVAERFSLDGAAALRFLRTLEREGYLTRHEAMKTYSVGPKLLVLHRLQATSIQIITMARPILVELAQGSGHSSHLGILNGTQAVLLEVVASRSKVAINQAIGDLEPLYSSAVGKALYSFLPKGERTRLGRKIHFVPLTRNTLRSHQELEAHSAEIRASGIAFDCQEGDEDVACIACPILDKKGYPVASIGLSLVSAYLDKPLIEQKEDIARVQDAARKIQDLLAPLTNAQAIVGAYEM